LRSLLQRIAALAGLDLGKGLDQIEALRLGEGDERRLLGFDADARFACRCRKLNLVGVARRIGRRWAGWQISSN
jgi:hypothetical protein